MNLVAGVLHTTWQMESQNPLQGRHVARQGMLCCRGRRLGPLLKPWTDRRILWLNDYYPLGVSTTAAAGAKRFAL